MLRGKRHKFKEALLALENSLQFHSGKNLSEKEQEIAFLAVSKAFEVAIEYAWRELKRRVESEGLEAPSPKEAIRQGAVIGLIDDPEMWINFVNARNDSVHDYHSMPEGDCLILARQFAKECKGLIKKL